MAAKEFSDSDKDAYEKLLKKRQDTGKLNPEDDEKYKLLCDKKCGSIMKATKECLKTML